MFTDLFSEEAKAVALESTGGQKCCERSPAVEMITYFRFITIMRTFGYKSASYSTILVLKTGIFSSTGWQDTFHSTSK